MQSTFEVLQPKEANKNTEEGKRIISVKKGPGFEIGCTSCKHFPSFSCTTVSKKTAMGYAPHVVSSRKTFLQYQGVQAGSKASWPDLPWNYLLCDPTEISRVEHTSKSGKQDAHF